jgi:hypothetical protein
MGFKELLMWNDFLLQSKKTLISIEFKLRIGTGIIDDLFKLILLGNQKRR